MTQSEISFKYVSTEQVSLQRHRSSSVKRVKVAQGNLFTVCLPALSKILKNNFRRAASLPDMKLKEFTPAISANDCDDETYSFQCSCPGLYQCSVSGLVFNMKGEGGVAYRTVPWNRRLLAQHHKKPAGPLFDIKCLQQSVCQLHLPHCEIISTGGGRSLQVAHVSDEGIEFIGPHQVTETHVVVNISGFSAYGNVKDEDSPPDPVQALVLLFYKPPEDPDLRSVLSVLLLPRNIVIRDVQRTRRKLIGEERYLDTSPHCKLQSKQVYTLSTSPEDDLIKVQPKETDFDGENHESYFPSFQVVFKRILTEIHLSLRHKSSSSCVWESEVCLLANRLRTVTLPPKDRLLNVWSSFIDGISGPVLSSLMDKLLEKTVITDAEREAADGKKGREKARFVIDTVRRKNASLEMIECLSELDPFFCSNLGLI
ncbi:NACHT, LRR and PYD domains-containing protein 1b allele 3-like [Archocentrus centrarchus]|uniref:NACHT, LRR and PYD domains-containing protein 1b allele 3-like n=1 Tax=Archocentrus centrarchus TaxID=63155 RepID=UPI0011EA4AC6|nr:NACHT, LRR and PYD domains-containing protein 1b allele 3-like [Archocentrus centrarchus]